MPALLLLTMLMMALRGAGDSLTPLWFMIVAVLLDSGLNPVFILGLGPAPRARHRRLGDRDGDRQLHQR
jgi:Na+-driven multidrug efflux pump